MVDGAAGREWYGQEACRAITTVRGVAVVIAVEGRALSSQHSLSEPGAPSPLNLPLATRCALSSQLTLSGRGGCITFVAARVSMQVRAGPGWNETAILLTWDDPGGFYDHVPPPMGVPAPDGPHDLPSFPDKGFVFDRLGIR